MSIETLNTAARAAGYAMAASDEAAPDDKPRFEPEAPQGYLDETRLLADFAPKTTASVGEWVKGVFSVFGRGAPA